MIRRLKIIARFILESFISFVGPKSFYILNANNILILTYHRVLPADHPDLQFEQPGMYVSPETFKLHMEELKRRFKLIHLNDWIDATRDKQLLPKYCCAVTFDDGWLDNYEYAYPIIRELSIPVTIFAVSSYVGTRYSFWPNRLGRLLGRLNKEELRRLLNSENAEPLRRLNIFNDDFISNGLDADKINRVIEQCKVYSEDEINNFIDKWISEFDEQIDLHSADLASQSQLEEMVKSGLVRVGSHTCHHKKLQENLSQHEVDIEIIQSKSELQSMLNSSIDLFCYPNGNFTDYSLSVVKDNYSAACSTIRGWNTPKSNFMLLKRIGLHEDISYNRHKFLARLSGFL